MRTDSRIPSSQGEDMSVFRRPDGRWEKYYAAGDPFLVEGLERLQAFWGHIATSGLSQLQGQLDSPLPLQLKAMGHHGAEAMAHRFGSHLWDQAAATPTGLIPYTFPFTDPTTGVWTGGRQAIRVAERATEWLEWFPEDPGFQEHASRLVAATVSCFDQPGSGLHNWVSVDTGRPPPSYPRLASTLTIDFGFIGKAIATLAQVTGVRRHDRWLCQKLDFAWEQRPDPQLPILVEQFTPDRFHLQGGAGQTSDSDTLYHVQKLFQIARLGMGDRWLEQARAVTEQWASAAWLPAHGHFTRKLRFDGSPLQHPLYGDGKRTTLWALVEAHQATGEDRFLDRFRLAWDNLLTRSTNEHGLIDSRFEAGVGNGEPEAEQHLFVEILLAAHHASRDAALLEAAQDLAARMLDARDVVMTWELTQEGSGAAGRALLNTALARTCVQRLEVEMGGHGRRLRVHRGSDPVAILDEVVPADIAVVHLPADAYRTVVE